jgi:hypothetical protein
MSVVESLPDSPEVFSKPLDHFHRLTDLLADRVRSVAQRFQTGAYIVGRPGAGKSYTVCRVLEECGTDYTVLNARVTPAALYDAIEDKPDAVLVIDDVSSLFANAQAAQILLAAVGGDPGIARRVTYLTKGLRRVTEFSGGVVVTSNVPLGRDPVAAALISRMALLQHEPTDDMMIAFMEAEARKGVKDVSATECLEVFEHVVAVCRGGDYRPDLRYFFKGIEDYRCWKSGGCKIDWRVLVRSGMQRVDASEVPPVPVTRAGKKAAEYEVVRELNTLDLSAPELEKEWAARTRKSMDTYYRRRRELGLR